MIPTNLPEFIFAYVIAIDRHGRDSEECLHLRKTNAHWKVFLDWADLLDVAAYKHDPAF